jgi:hypothetical protein
MNSVLVSLSSIPTANNPLALSLSQQFRQTEKRGHDNLIRLQAAGTLACLSLLLFGFFLGGHSLHSYGMLLRTQSKGLR